MSNVTNVTKVYNEPVYQRQVGDMEPGEKAYTIPWAYNKHLRRLDETVEIMTFKSVENTLFVHCVEKGKYELDFT